jgi:excisionase family DNA binding protein
MEANGATMKKQENKEVIQPLNLDVHGAARFLGTTAWAIRKLANKGKLPFVKIGKRFLFSRVELEKWNQRQMKRRAK